MTDRDGEKVTRYMQELKDSGRYKVSAEIHQKLAQDFKVRMLREEEVLETIKRCYQQTKYVLGTHTAIGYGVLKRYQNETKDQTKTIL